MPDDPKATETKTRRWRKRTFRSIGGIAAVSLVVALASCDVQRSTERVLIASMAASDSECRIESYPPLVREIVEDAGHKPDVIAYRLDKRLNTQFPSGTPVYRLLTELHQQGVLWNIEQLDLNSNGSTTVRMCDRFPCRNELWISWTADTLGNLSAIEVHNSAACL